MKNNTAAANRIEKDAFEKDTYNVFIGKTKARMYAANDGKWNVALPPAKGSRWAAGIRQFASFDEAMEWAKTAIAVVK